MRISTQSFYEQSLTAIGAQQSNLLRIQQQLGAGTKLLAPSDDPLAATRGLAVSQSIALGAQYAASRGQATQTLTMEENALQSVTTVLQNIKGLLIQAGNGTLTDADRATIATTLQSNMDQLQGLANADDGNGQFLFAGYKSSSAPFVRQGDGSIQYVGDQGQRLMQVDVSRQMAGADDGRRVFQSVQGGAGYVTASPAGNAGSGVFSATSVVDMDHPDYGRVFEIKFSGAGTALDPLMYTADTVPPQVPAATPAAFTAGSPISVGGLQFTLTGTPKANDSFSLAPAQNAGTNVFESIKDVIAALQTPVDNAGAEGQAKVLNALSTANRKISNAHDNVLSVRASVGSRLQELDALAVTGESRALLDRSHLSDLQDLDYATAIAEFYQRQTALQASQQTFVRIQQISLFNYL
ncbi:flagellar hook-associated protein FlgL [Rhodoferax sp.]|uniref:flagellar hook-associated protein FlgL n=1 Tax=Rhodoferax sp. TaxID=50421 RepID=UPI002731CE47|nr:flagellar hook-associated protein FlgL [Rhodoferax sp.]MDP1530430.1 flagellar hook-associated protein FlgL [Rhodoferax sp.]MDP1943224.1 flagellar hook-associated protein FlgL [Rhodoferax sp.]MDP2442732.1 flagellar hook-associated protein FlgL [Rhodoferax sp.]MDZ4206378.1 flagellar hook-associated protein FlgL [Rhodoferax sp.]